MRILRLIPCILAILLIFGCKEKENATRQSPVVKIDTVRSEKGSGELQYPGRVVSSSDANISFKVAGTLKRVYVDEGERVKAGQLIAELDPTDYQIQLNATKAEYAQIKADAERVIGLYKDGGTTASNYDKARYGLEQIEAKLQNHKNQLSYTKIYAPFAGTVDKKFFDSNETVGAGMPVVSILGSGLPEVEVNLPATSYVHKDNFFGYSCTLDVLPGEVLPLKLISIMPQANANQLYTMRLKLEHNSKEIAPGMSTWVTIRSNNAFSGWVVVPCTALVAEKSKSYVYIYSDRSKEVKKVEVQVQKLHTDGTAVVLGELHDGDLVVSSGAHHVRDGVKVQLLAPVSSTNVGGLL